MITIIKRELLDYLQSVQFVVLICICIILFLANGMIFAKKYSQQISFYNEKVSMSYPSTFRTTLYRQPKSLLFMAEGGDKYRPYGYILWPKGVLDNLPSGSRNFKMPEIPELDWSFIIKIILSLYVILLGYNAISGEKEQGTLRLIMSNSLGRVKILMAKYISILLTVLVPLLTGSIIALIVVAIFFPQILTLSNFSRILLMLLLTLAYLSVFIFMSLLFSSLIHRSSLVLLMLLAAWVLFAIIIPNTSGILSQRFLRIPSEYEMAKMVGPMIQQQIWARINEIKERVSKGELKNEEEVKQEADRAFNEGQNELIKHHRSYENAMKQRAILAENISRISPAALFEYAAENIAQTGAKREEHFLMDVQRYSNIYDSYVLKKIGKLATVFRWTFSTDIIINGKSITIRSPYPVEYRGDKSDFPHFMESQPSLARSLRNALFDIAGLIVWNLLLATLAFSAFLVADVR